MENPINPFEESSQSIATGTESFLLASNQAVAAITQMSGNIKESAGVNYNTTNPYILNGRKHQGDENGTTNYYFTDFSYGKSAILWNNQKTSAEMKESNSSFESPADAVLVGRWHKGDENGKTTYSYATPYLQDDVRSVIVGPRTWGVSQKESKSDYTAPSNTCLTGRSHQSDENGQTSYQYAPLYIQSNAFWQDYLPILQQPTVDANAYPVEKIFVDASNPLAIKYSVVFRGEGAYNPVTQQINNIATLFYEAFTYNCWNRTADVEMFTINFNSNQQPESVTFNSNAYNQTFFTGKSNLEDAIRNYLPNSFEWTLNQIANLLGVTFNYLSDTLLATPLYDDNIKTDNTVAWSHIQKNGQRPYIYVNTANHLFGPNNNNSNLAMLPVDVYKSAKGTRENANKFGESLPINVNKVFANIIYYTIQQIWPC